MGEMFGESLYNFGQKLHSLYLRGIINHKSNKMKHLLFISVSLLAISCSQPYAKVDINDEKSVIINKIFEEVSAERIDYLNEVFSDDMKMVNSKEISFNKKEFIAGIEEMFDLFEDITFESVDGDANGSEIETNYYSNGKIW